MEENKISRLFVIEDDKELVVYGLKEMFRQLGNYRIVGVATSVGEAIKKAASLQVDIFILDLFIPGSEPKENLKLIRENFPGIPVIIFTQEKSAVWQQHMMEAGANAYITKNVDAKTMRQALDKVLLGERYVGPGIIYSAASAGDNEDSITPLELRIVDMLSRGVSHQKVAEMLKLSGSTINKVLQDLRKRFHAENTLHLTRILIEKYGPLDDKSQRKV
jgi:DNA-binding NarL/FixJ family response regulator